jgi:hypothetical protein
MSGEDGIGGVRMGQARDIDEFAEYAAASMRDLRRAANLLRVDDNQPACAMGVAQQAVE